MGTRRTYDHRIRQAIVASGDPDLFPHLHIPRSTVRTWLKEGPREVVALADGELSRRIRVAHLEKQLAILREVIRLLLAWKRVVGPLLDHQHFDAPDKAKLLTALTKARQVMPLRAALCILGLRPGRYHAWVNREQQCQLDDPSSCARQRPGRLSFDEARKMADLVTSAAHRHMSIRALALYAQRTEQAFAHPVAWSRLIKEHGWRFEEHLNPLNTFHVLSDATLNLKDRRPADVVMDAGVENVNSAVDGLFSSRQLRRVLAQVDVTFSSSLIEAWWRSLKHQ